MRLPCTLSELDPNENYTTYLNVSRKSEDGLSYIPDIYLHNFGIVAKTVFTDAVTDKQDSSYYYAVNESGNVSNIVLRLASKEDIARLKKEIKADIPQLNF